MPPTASVSRSAERQVTLKVNRLLAPGEPVQTGCSAEVTDEGPPVTNVLASVYDSLDVISVFIFGVLGGLLAVRRQLPLPLVTLSALLTGLGGGLVRDLIIEAPPVAFHRPDYLAAVVVAAALVAFAHSYLNRYKGCSRLSRPSASHCSVWPGRRRS